MQKNLKNEGDKLLRRGKEILKIQWFKYKKMQKMHFKLAISFKSRS